MKKTILPLFLLAFVLFYSCSSSENEMMDDEDSSEILSNYKITFASGSAYTHFFDGTKGVETLNSNGIKNIDFKYNTNNNLENLTTFFFTDNIDESYTFNYDSNDVLVSCEELSVYSYLDSDVAYTREFTYSDNSIISEVPHNDFTYITYRTEFKLNEEGLIEEFIQTDSNTNELNAQYLFSYDENENCTSVIKRINFLGSVTELSADFTYDDKVNPLYKHYKDNFLPYLIVYGKLNLFGGDITELITTFGKNNIINDSVLYYEYEYNNNGYPKNVTAKQIGTNILFSTTEFSYE